MVAVRTASMVFNKLIGETLGKFLGICGNIVGMMLLARWRPGL
jgi:hypothetical protein